METKHYIDNSVFMELVSDLAHRNTELNYGENTVTWESNGVSQYTEFAQDFFNEEYDKIEERLNAAGIYSDNEREVVAPPQPHPMVIKLMQKMEEAQQMIRDLRDSDNHICPCHENIDDPDGICSCGGYDAVIDKLDTQFKI